ncbi:hypothetical protein F53441_9035 [Fusarium austroafricanum]|uniref:Uncharacterized protein n=1 Tax=Fusarium austroafricanum TaxID=2364996 RepID=A0A8H4KCP8_9HYPO|nr:hypothetical protein F53441_9035 [Fusarium austroafricanum]
MSRRFFHRSKIHAQALLSGISRIGIFYDEENGSEKHKGILLIYKKGGQRALGICRVELDPIKFYEEPSGLRYRYRAQAGPWKESSGRLPDLYEIECYTGTHDETDSAGTEWTCSLLEGHVVQCQWDYEMFEMRVIDPGAQ